MAGHDFDELARAKHRYDFMNVLASGRTYFFRTKT